MGDPADSCFKQKISPFITWVNTTTTTTTTVPPGTVSPEFDFFIIPSSGGWCPVPQIGPNNQISRILLEPPIENETITSSCAADAYVDKICVINFLKYIEVGSITVDSKICSLYKLKLSGQHKDLFVINNLKLYILGSVLDFDQPSQQYNVTVNLVNPINFDIIDYIDHTVIVDNTCECTPLITTTTTTTSTTASPQVLTFVKRNVGLKRWSGVYSSSNGNVLAAVCFGETSITPWLSVYSKERIRISYDSGVNWTECANTENVGWKDITGSDNGSILFAAAWNDYIYKSSNYGATWSPLLSAGKKRWNKIVCSSDGSIVIAHVYNSNKVLISTNGGIFWVIKTIGMSLTTNPLGIIMSSNGSTMFYLDPGATLYRSINYGASWLQFYDRLGWGGNPGVFGLETKLLAGSSDCSKQITTFSGYVNMSYNSGLSWEQKQPKPLQRWWINFAMSDNGTTSLAIEGNSGYIYRTNDSGNSWAEYVGGVNGLIACSYDCNKFVAVGLDSDIYTGEFV